MRKLTTLLLLLVVAASAFAQDRAAQIREKLLSCDTTTVLVAAHRGDWRNFPENSLEAIESAINMGVDIVEIDLQRTKDGQLILMHDDRLNRTTNCKGVIADTTLAYIRTLYLKNGCDITTKHRVPTLEEALLLAKGRVMLNLDKADRYFEEVYELLQRTGTTQQIIMKGGRPSNEVMELYGPYLKDVTYMPIVNLDNDDGEQRIEAFVSGMHPVAFELIYANPENPLPQHVGQTLKGRSLIWYNSLWDTLCGAHDDDASLRDIDDGWGYLIDRLGTRIIQTDRPQMLLQYLRQRGMHE